MKAESTKLSRLLKNGEVVNLLRHSLFVLISTSVSLALRYYLMANTGVHTLNITGRRFDMEITDSTAYSAYYISGIAVLYLLKWFFSNGVRVRSFVPRLLAFCGVYALSYLCGYYLLRLFTENWGIGDEPAFWMTCPFTFIINFLGNRLIVFYDAENRQVDKFNRKASGISDDDGGGNHGEQAEE